MCNPSCEPVSSTFLETKNVPETFTKKERLMAQHTVGRTDASGRWGTDLSYVFSSRPGGRCNPHTSNVSRRSERAQCDTGGSIDYRQDSMTFPNHRECSSTTAR